MKKLPILKTILNAVRIRTGTFTAATSNVITSAAHGLKDRDLVILTTTGTLPAGLTTLTTYIVDQVTTDTFQLIKKSTGATADITDTGTGVHTFTVHDIGWSINVENYVNKEILVDTDGGGTAAGKIYFVGSWQDTEPDFSAAKAVDNQFEHIAVRDRQDNSVIAGDTGITFSSADDHRVFNLENNAVKWVNVIFDGTLGMTAGEVTVRIKCSDNS